MKTKTIRKLFFAWNMDKEKLFLEEQARNGWLLRKVKLGKYEFEESKPVDMVYQFDFQMMGKGNEEEYLSMFEEWELVVRYGGWYYFRKERDEKSNQIFSNVDSVKSMYHRLLGFLALVGFPLYYQILILFPRVSENGIPTFYKFFMPFVIVIAGLHLFAVIRLLFSLRDLNNITE